MLLLAAAALLVSVLILASSGYPKTAPDSSSSTTNQSGNTQIVLDFGNGEALSRSQAFQRGETAYSILASLTDENDIPMNVQQYDFGVFVSSIGGFESGSNKAWIYFVNGTSGNVAADKYFLEPGDLIEWRYIPPSQG
jgi:hypothetical protein